MKVAAKTVLKHFPTSNSQIVHVKPEQLFGTFSEIKIRRPPLRKSRNILGYSPSGYLRVTTNRQWLTTRYRRFFRIYSC